MWAIAVFLLAITIGGDISKDVPQERWGQRELITYHHNRIPAMCEDVIGEHR